MNVELIEVRTNDLVWREPIEVDYTSAFELQDIVAQKVVEGLNLQFSSDEMDRLHKDIPEDPLAYEYYLRSISLPYTNEGDRYAIELLNKAIVLDSVFAPSYARLADRMHRLAYGGSINPEETNKSEQLFLKALSINKKQIYALANLAQIYTETARTGKAVELIRQILSINPSSAESHHSLGYLYRYTGMNAEAAREMEKAVRLDPKNPGFRSIVITYYNLGDYKLAIATSENYYQTAFMLSVKGLSYFKLGDMKNAEEYFNQSLAVDSVGLAALFSTAMNSVIEGNRDKGVEAGLKFEEMNILDAEAWYTMSFIYGALGNRDGCIRCLRRTVDGGYFNYPLILTDTYFDFVREDEAFQSILQIAKEKHLAFKERYF